MEMLSNPVALIKKFPGYLQDTDENNKQMKLIRQTKAAL